MRIAIVVLVFLLANLKLSASEKISVRISFPDTTIQVVQESSDSAGALSVAGAKHFHLTENKRVVAAILAFPPFGCLGLHRIYLGTAPWVPVVYTLTLGGAGIIALIDFIEICTVDDATFESYSHNENVFLWGK